MVVIVVLIVIVLLFMVYPRFSKESDISDEERTVHILRVYDSAFTLMQSDLGYFPETNEGMVAIYKNVNNDMNWKGPYLGALIEPKDIWGRVIVYRFPGKCKNNSDSKNYELYSFGKNGIDECLGGDDIAVTKSK